MPLSQGQSQVQGREPAKWLLCLNMALCVHMVLYVQAAFRQPRLSIQFIGYSDIRVLLPLICCLLPGNAPANFYLLKGDGKKTPKESKFNLDNLAISFSKNIHGTEN